ncbi:hypothetical protein SLEP1_g50514 [Rubroshorea leprosula]|uniref:Glycosyltransferase n=1 Tax=Rubroshorea leprosula TaxID=152421 RepID=A0AAV5M3G3_9ROSI|nr:hypothetical protein SLEP1_g50514 [Rubroshorea leprosula]
MASKDYTPASQVLLVAFSAQGHINPMLRLGKRLASKGLHVTLATTEIVRHRMFKSPTTTTHSISGIQLLFFSDGFTLDYDRKTNLDHYMDTLGMVGPVNLSNLINDHYHNLHKKLSCIISNPFVPWVVDVAADHGIPCAMLWIQPCSLYAIYYRFYNNLNPFTTEVTSTTLSTNDSESTIDVPGLPLLHTEDLPTFVLPSNPVSSLSRLLSDLILNLKKHKWVLANSFFELEKEATESMDEICPIIPVGPLVPSSLLGEDQDVEDGAGIDLWKPEETCLDWLENQAPSSVIYVSFGSLAVLPAKLMEAIATALKNTKHPFLWVVKKPEGSPGNGAGELPPEFEEETKGQGLVVSWCPQTKVLAHPAIGCFITHCGWNSLLETFSAGVPVIGYPQWSDQPTNAKLVVDVFKVGLRLRPSCDGVFTAEEVEKCLKEIMGGSKSEQLKKNAAELKRAAREAVAAGGSSDRNIQLFVQEILGSDGTSAEGSAEP